VGITGPFSGITYADWDFGLAVNLGGVINGLQTFVPRMRAHGAGGHVVNTASLAALVPMPAAFVTYVAAKAAVVTISETIRAELAQENIGVSVLCRGPVKTNIHEVAKNRPARFGVGDAFRQAERGGAVTAFGNPWPRSATRRSSRRCPRSAILPWWRWFGHSARLAELRTQRDCSRRSAAQHLDLQKPKLKTVGIDHVVRYALLASVGNATRELHLFSPRAVLETQ
jgi:NAD(P)-dependent dehydrogenase (short-subunit alcohol dehydrogenase family)